MPERPLSLTPAQQFAADQLIAALACSDVLVLAGDHGSGKSTVLRWLSTKTGGALIGARQFMESLRLHQPAAFEEAFLDLMEAALAAHEVVIFDDLDLVNNVVEGCDYPRAFLLNLPLTAILDQARSMGKQIVFALTGHIPAPVESRGLVSQIQAFSAEDYAAIARTYLKPDVAGRLDYAQIHRFAPELTAHQLRNTCIGLRSEPTVDTNRFIEYLQAHDLTSNVKIQEVETVRWSDLKGLDDVIHALEAKIALPFENDALADELALKPKRGVLLVGPPGTGKTTIGRALAHRLKGKFFLLDGTVIADTNNFYGEVSRVFEAARQNAPSVIFIDDADVIFEDHARPGFYRYLLTMLDGLESHSRQRVCVMMTAMEASSLPAALVRSGRVELWLETRLPDEKSRTLILTEKLSKLPLPIGQVDIALVARASRGLTGADLKTVVEDGKLLFAYDKTNGTALRPAEAYFLDAIQRVRSNRRAYKRRRALEFSEVQFGFCARGNY